MKYGAKMLMWAPFAAENAEPEGALPKYGAAVNLGALNRVTDSPVFNEAKGYGDNALKVHVNEFKECAVDVEVTELSNANAAAVFGATLATGDGDLRFGADNNAPYGGLAFFINKMLDGNRKVWQGVFYPKLKASMQGEEYATKGDSITLTTSKAHFLAAACQSGDWKILSTDFDTEAEAISWVTEKLKASAS